MVGLDCDSKVLDGRIVVDPEELMSSGTDVDDEDREDLLMACQSLGRNRNSTKSTLWRTIYDLLNRLAEIESLSILYLQALGPWKHTQ